MEHLEMTEFEWQETLKIIRKLREHKEYVSAPPKSGGDMLRAYEDNRKDESAAALFQ